MDKILEKLEKIEERLNLIEEKINVIKTDSSNMTHHINFVENVYNILRSPLNYFVNDVKKLPKICIKNNNE